MKLNSSALYLSLALESLESAVVPDLQSSAAKDAAATIRKCLEQVLAREECDVSSLRDKILEGDAIATRLLALARDLGVDVPAARSLEATFDHFADFSAVYEALTARLAALAHALSRSRGDIDTPEESAVLLRAAAQWESDVHAALLSQPSRNEATSRSGLSQEMLQAFVQNVHPDGSKARVTAFERVPGGFGKQTYMFTLRAADSREQQLIVRKSDPVPPLLHRDSRLDREFQFVRAIAATGYPAPRPLWYGTNVPGIDADFYVMERLPGRIPASFLGGAAVPESVAFDMAECLARLHGMGPRDFPDCVATWEDVALLSAGDTVEACNRRIIASWRQYVSEVPHPPSPIIEYLLDWLETHVPHDPRTPVLIHGDYNVHNVLAENGRLSGVLDWEVVGFGAPEQDIAFVKPTISQHLPWERFYERYQACGGRPCDFQSLGYYQAFGAMRVLLAGARVTHNLDSGAIRDIRLTMFELGLNPQFMRIALDNTG